MNTRIDPKHWRLNGHLSMAAMAAAAGVRGKNPSRTWQRWETGERAPPLRVIVEIERISDGVINAGAWNTVRQAFLNGRRKSNPLQVEIAADAASSQPEAR
jgi:transcriptional regulator with XRE-family HTH domain